MKARKVYEGYNNSHSFAYKAINQGMSNRFGKSNSKLSRMLPYVYKNMPYNHSLEQSPTHIDNYNPLKVGMFVVGKRFKNYNDKTQYKGSITHIHKSVDGYIERIIINSDGTKYDLDPETVVNIDFANFNQYSAIYIVDDTMEFDDI